jgi:hypothetical protein
VRGLRCVDGSSLVIIPVPSHDRRGTPYEITLELMRDGGRFGVVGERCGHALAALSRLLAAARSDDSPQASAWPDLDDRFPDPPLDRALRATGCRHDLSGYLPKERELFAFRCRDRGDLASTGELRCALRTSCCWVAARDRPEHRGPERGGSAYGGPERGGSAYGESMGAGGQWRVARRAVLDAWGASGRGVRAVLTSGELSAFLAELLGEAERVGAGYRDLMEGVVTRRSR